MLAFSFSQPFVKDEYIFYRFLRVSVFEVNAFIVFIFLLLIVNDVNQFYGFEIQTFLMLCNVAQTDIDASPSYSINSFSAGLV